MSNLLKSKILLGVMIVAVVFVGAFAFTAKASACDLGSTTLKLKSTGAAVTCLQTDLNVTPATGYFGTKTLAAVKAFQTEQSLTADGVAGALTRAALTANPVAGTFSAGCTSATGFSTTTGLACTASTSTVAGCAAGALFSSTTGLSCTSTLPAGCVAGALFSSTTGLSCGTTTYSTSGAGDITITQTSADVENQAPEGTDTKVLGFRAEATGSDIVVNNVKVQLTNTTTFTDSTRLDHYAGSVSVYMGSTKVGSANASDFTKDGLIYTVNIPLSGATVKLGSANKQTFYVDVTALSNIDSGDATGAGTQGADNFWAVSIPSLRFVDGSGLTMTDVTNPTTNFSFYKIVAAGNLKLPIVTTSASPEAGNVSVSDTGSTSNILLNEFTMKPTGADMTMTTLGVMLTSTTDTVPHIAQNLVLKANGVQVAEIDTTLGAVATPTLNTFTLDSDYNMTAGQTYTFGVYAQVNKIGTGTFAQGDSLQADYSTAAVETTVGGASVATIMSGSSVGYPQTFFSTGLNATNFVSSVSASAPDPVTGLITQTYTITYKLTAFGDTYYVPKTVARNLVATPYVGYDTIPHAQAGTNGLGYSLMTSAGVETDTGATTSSSSISSTDASTSGAYFSIPDGAQRTFRITVQMATGAPAGFYHVQLNQVLYDLDAVAGGASIYNLTPTQNYATDDAHVN